MTRVLGMVQVAGTTYRIESLRPTEYTVVRLLDDVSVGSFRSFPCFEVTSCYVDPALLRQIARTAMVAARTNWDRGAPAQLGGPGSATIAAQLPLSGPRAQKGLFGVMASFSGLGFKLDGVRSR